MKKTKKYDGYDLVKILRKRNDLKKENTRIRAVHRKVLGVSKMFVRVE